MKRISAMRGAAAALIIVGCLPTYSLAQSAAPAPASVPQARPTLPALHGPWTVSPAIAARLGKPSSVDNYSINPPSGFKASDRDSPDGFGHAYIWTLPLRSDGTQPEMDIVVATAPKGEASQFTVDQILTNFIANIRAAQINWTATTGEHGSLNGIPFEREYWVGTDDAKGYFSRGFVYISEPSIGTYIIVSGRDSEPTADTNVPLMEAAALTLRPSGAASPPGAPH